MNFEVQYPFNGLINPGRVRGSEKYEFFGMKIRKVKEGREAEKQLNVKS